LGSGFELQGIPFIERDKHQGIHAYLYQRRLSNLFTNNLNSESASFFSELFDNGEVVFGLLPEIWGKEFVGFGESFVGGSEGVLSGVRHTFS